MRIDARTDWPSPELAQAAGPRSSELDFAALLGGEDVALALSEPGRGAPLDTPADPRRLPDSAASIQTLGQQVTPNTAEDAPAPSTGQMTTPNPFAVPDLPAVDDAPDHIHLTRAIAFRELGLFGAYTPAKLPLDPATPTRTCGTPNQYPHVPNSRLLDRLAERVPRHAAGGLGQFQWGGGSATHVESVRGRGLPKAAAPQGGGAPQEGEANFDEVGPEAAAPRYDRPAMARGRATMAFNVLIAQRDGAGQVVIMAPGLAPDEVARLRRLAGEAIAEFGLHPTDLVVNGASTFHVSTNPET